MSRTITKLRAINKTEQELIIKSTLKDVVEDLKYHNKRSFNRIPYGDCHLMISSLDGVCQISFDHPIINSYNIIFDIGNYKQVGIDVLKTLDGLLDYVN